MAVLATFIPILFAAFISALPHNESRASTTNTILAKRGDPPGGQIKCAGSPHFLVSNAWTVGIPGDTLSNYGTGSSTLGGGLLDNLRGQCGDITNWTAETDTDDLNNLAVYFETTVMCDTTHVQNAIWLANGMNYDSVCSMSATDDALDFSWLDDQSESVAAGLESVLEALAL